MMLPFLKAPADAPLMTDKYEIDARYRYWRRHILLTIWLGYALFYFTRKSFNAAVPEILANGVLSRSDIGLLATLFYITYGVSKFVSGIVSDRSNARYFMGIGLIATGIINILFGFSTSLWAFAALGAERLFPGLGFTGVCASVNGLVFTYRARRLVGIMEHGA
jgi:MFS transporter, OPA family, sugar phosphate sensor protein UhpC